MAATTIGCIEMNIMLTALGREQNVDPHTAEDVPSIVEIAHSLAQINRFTGHCVRPYSVAEHSMLVSRIIRDDFGHGADVQLAALMHDAHECIVNDVATPNKRLIGDGWKYFEDAWEERILQHYGLFELVQANAQIIKRADLIALATERRDLMLFAPTKHRPWALLEGIRPCERYTISSHDQDWHTQRAEFVIHYEELTAMVDSGWGKLR